MWSYYVYAVGVYDCDLWHHRPQTSTVISANIIYWIRKWWWIVVESHIQRRSAICWLIVHRALLLSLFFLYFIIIDIIISYCGFPWITHGLNRYSIWWANTNNLSSTKMLTISRHIFFLWSSLSGIGLIMSVICAYHPQNVFYRILGHWQPFLVLRLWAYTQTPKHHAFQNDSGNMRRFAFSDFFTGFFFVFLRNRQGQEDY